ncbi:DUF732 domain-containing protein [Geodermatophilus sp. SYSU D00691]
MRRVRRLAGVVAAIGVVLLAGCQDADQESAADPTPSSTSSSGLSALEQYRADNPNPEYLAEDPEDVERLRDASYFVDLTNAGLADEGTPGELVAFAEQVCAFLDRGHTVAQAGGVAVDSGYTPSEAVDFIAIAVTNFCPEHTAA